MSESKCPFKTRHDFKNECFYYFLPLFNYVKKNLIGEKINKFQGTISFSLKENIYILIENESDINSKEFQNEILSFGYVHFFNQEQKYVEIKCTNQKIQKPPKYNCILLDDFWNAIKHFDTEEDNFNSLCKHGLKQNVNKESLIAIYIPLAGIKKVIYHVFPTIKEFKWQINAKTRYDIPQYIDGIPDGFAIFCTTWEAGKVRKYVEQNQLKDQNNKDNEKNDEDINVEDMDVINNKLIEKKDGNKKIKLAEELEEPIPRSEHQYCHLCKIKFDNYLVHIKSISHMDNQRKNPNTIHRIQDSFERILDFWDKKCGRDVRIRKRTHKENNNINNNNNVLLNKKILYKEEDFSTKEGSSQEPNNLFNNNNNINSNTSLNRNINININNNNGVLINNNIHNNMQINNNIIYNNLGKIHIINNNSSSNNNNILNKNVIKNNNINININNSNVLNCNKENEKRNYIQNAIIRSNNNNFSNYYSYSNCNKNSNSQRKFVTSTNRLFTTTNANTYKKRKKNEFQCTNTSGIFVINTPPVKPQKNDYFLILNRDNPKKLINKNIIFFK